MTNNVWPEDGMLLIKLRSYEHAAQLARFLPGWTFVQHADTHELGYALQPEDCADGVPPAWLSVNPWDMTRGSRRRKKAA